MAINTNDLNNIDWEYENRKADRELEEKMVRVHKDRANDLGITLQEYLSIKLLMKFEFKVEPYLEKAKPHIEKQSNELEYIREILKIICKAM